MSWVTDVVLLSSLSERFDGAKMLDEPVAVAKINKWLEQGDWAPLACVEDALSTEKAFQACAYGGALNRLDVPAFLRVVAQQPWTEPTAVMLLLKNENEEAFTPYRLDSNRSILKIM